MLPLCLHRVKIMDGVNPPVSVGDDGVIVVSEGIVNARFSFKHAQIPAV